MSVGLLAVLADILRDFPGKLLAMDWNPFIAELTCNPVSIPVELVSASRLTLQ
jgi:hypothetical protein